MVQKRNDEFDPFVHIITKSDLVSRVTHGRVFFSALLSLSSLSLSLFPLLILFLSLPH